MRTPDRDRRRPAVPALCAALVILLALAVPAGALSAEYRVFANGTAYNATIAITDTDRYTFADVGFMGEDVPLAVGDVALVSEGVPVAFNWTKPWGAPASISFEKGNYTVFFTAPLKDHNLKAVYKKPYNVTVDLPMDLRVDNLLLAGISNGANVTRHTDNTTTITWTNAPAFDLRFYSQAQEQLLFFFLQFMAILTFVLVVIPYVVSRRQDG